MKFIIYNFKIFDFHFVELKKIYIYYFRPLLVEEINFGIESVQILKRSVFPKKGTGKKRTHADGNSSLLQLKCNTLCWVILFMD